jgi:hypothetical protein
MSLLLRKRVPAIVLLCSQGPTTGFYILPFNLILLAHIGDWYIPLLPVISDSFKPSFRNEVGKQWRYF